MIEEIKVSVICLTYNHAEYIESALEGFVSQKTDFKYEVIIHDDASTDETPTIIKRYEKKYPGLIKVVYQSENQYSLGRNILRNLSPMIVGKYVATCEGDDYWIDELKLQKQVDFLEKNISYSACVHNTYRLNLHNMRKTLINSQKQDYDIELEELFRNWGNVYQTSSLLYRKKYFEKRFTKERPPYFDAAKGFGDYPLGIFLLQEGKMHYMSDIMSVYRVLSKESWSSRLKNIENFERHINSLTKMLDVVDISTQYKYHQDIVKVIEKNNVDLLIKKRDIKTLKKQEVGYWKNISKIEKIKIYLKIYFPIIYELSIKVREKV